MRKYLRTLSLTLAAAMIAATAGGCSSPAGSSSSSSVANSGSTAPSTQSQSSSASSEAVPGNSWEGKEPVTITYYYDKSIATSDFDKWWGKDSVSKYLMENTNVDIEWMMAPDNDHSKLQIIVASGTLPDVITTERSLALMRDLVANDMVWPINELEKTAAPDFLERNIPDNVKLQFRISFDSMNIYCLPCQWYSEEAIADPSLIKNAAGVAVIEQLYQEMGSPDTSTLDGLLDMLRQAKAKYPDMIPVQASRNSGLDGDGNVRMIYKIFNMFDLASRYDIGEDGTYMKYFHSPKFLDLLKFVNTLYNEGLMDPAELTDTSETMQAKLFNGMVFCNLNQDSDNIDWFSTELQKVHPEWNWTMIDAPSAYADQGITYSNDGIGGGVGDVLNHFIIKNPNAERVLQFFDFIFQEQAQFYIARGMEDSWESYDENEKIAVLKPDIDKADDSIKKGQYGVGAYWLWRNSDITARHKKIGASDYQIASLDHNAQYYKDYSFFSGAETYASDSQENKIFSQVKEYYQTAVVDIIMCNPSEVETRYNAMMDQLESLGQGTLDEHINSYFQNKASIEAKYSEDLDLSYMKK